MEVNGIHFTLGGIAFAVGLAMGVIRLVSAVRPWFSWRRKVDIRLAALENPSNVEEMRKELL